MNGQSRSLGLELGSGLGILFLHGIRVREGDEYMVHGLGPLSAGPRHWTRTPVSRASALDKNPCQQGLATGQEPLSAGPRHWTRTPGRGLATGQEPLGGASPLDKKSSLGLWAQGDLNETVFGAELHGGGWRRVLDHASTFGCGLYSAWV